MKNSEKRNALLQKAKVISVMDNALIYPANLMKSLNMSIAQDTTKPVTSNLSDIKTYSVCVKETGVFIATLYAMDYAGKYYGNIVGMPEIVCFDKDAFCFERAENVCYPVEEDYFLRCEFDGSMNLVAHELVQVEDESETVFHEFGEGMPFFKALSDSWKMICPA